jgi:hypothetical protein
MIADNRLTENSQWDEQLLGEQFKILAEAELDFDLEITGFETAEIDLFIEGLTPANPKNDPSEIIPSLPAGVRISLPGDVWQLDRHRLFCGNALEVASYQLLMKRRLAAMIFSDFPYNVPIARNVSGLGKVKHAEFAMASGEMTQGEFVSFLSTAISQLAAHSVDGSLHYLCMDWRHMGELLAAGGRGYSELKNVRLDERQRGHGLAVPISARARLCLQKWY